MTDLSMPAPPVLRANCLAAVVHWAVAVVCAVAASFGAVLTVPPEVEVLLVGAAIVLTVAGSAFFAVERRDHHVTLRAYAASFAAFTRSAVPAVLEELATARSTFPSLGHRLDEVTTAAKQATIAVGQITEPAPVQQVVQAVIGTPQLVDFVHGLVAASLPAGSPPASPPAAPVIDPASPPAAPVIDPVTLSAA